MVRSKRSVPIEEEVSHPSPPLPIPEKLWNMECVAAFLDVGEDRVRWLIENRGLPHIRWGNTIRFHPGGVARWAEQQTVSTE